MVMKPWLVLAIAAAALMQGALCVAQPGDIAFLHVAVVDVRNGHQR